MKRNLYLGLFLCLLCAALFSYTACTSDDDDDKDNGGSPDNEVAQAACSKLLECAEAQFAASFSSIDDCATELDGASSGGEDGVYCYEYCATSLSCDEYLLCVSDCAGY